jgi:hypothetical protein
LENCTLNEQSLTLNGHSNLTFSKNKRPPVLIIHGFCQNSEAFVARKRAEYNLPLALANAGYDVWLGSIQHFQLLNQSHSFLFFDIIKTKKGNKSSKTRTREKIMS